MLWLPLQGAIAAIMPLCVQAKQIGVSLDIPAVTGACDRQHNDDDQAGSQAHTYTTDSAADDMTSLLPCESLPCYASFSTLLPSAYSALISIGGDFYTVSFDSRFTSVILRQPQRPPLA